jgi:molybdate transport system substrate-binding protein
MRFVGVMRTAILALCMSAPGLARELAVAAASDLTFALGDVAARFEERSGVSLKMSFGSSGNFFSQIQNGAPYDLFFSADVDYPKTLQAAGLVAPGTLYEYGEGKIVLWVRTESRIDLGRGIRSLLDPEVRSIAIANPKHAPYGRAAVAALRHFGIHDAVKDKLVFGENISQAAQFVTAGAADAGIVALSLALAPTMKDKGRFQEIPEGSYPAIKQAGAILKSSKRKREAAQFMQFLRRPEIVQLMRRYGFAVPNDAASGGGVRR